MSEQQGWVFDPSRYEGYTPWGEVCNTADRRLAKDAPNILAEAVRLRAENERLRAAAMLRIADWESVTQPGAACEGCDDPEDVAALRKALEDTEGVSDG